MMMGLEIYSINKEGKPKWEAVASREEDAKNIAGLCHGFYVDRDGVKHFPEN